ncbi:hypothetical protein [Oscillatoria acuminata]|uniref:Uncharacterized protein n=1 Tax=Oscillatoria acuminata PCC 6304 TaxID=56110 RepID=K9TLV6_9CYAN|nr:hypothetical protein [Oscillatoria acuminata]AFY83146.1 hypothetical protein Oscil6304_3583 [Oscillatoria acuminata PCC 6304]
MFLKSLGDRHPPPETQVATKTIQLRSQTSPKPSFSGVGHPSRNLVQLTSCTHRHIRQGSKNPPVGALRKAPLYTFATTP